MTQYHRSLLPVCASLLAAWLGCTAAVAQISVSAHFEPALIHVDEHSMYTVQITGAQGNVSGDMPDLGSLQVVGAQQGGTSVSTINGITTVRRTISMPMMAQAPGDYSVPSFRIELNGIGYQVPEARLQVLPVDEAARAAAAADSPVKLQMQLPQAPYYVGQAIPVTLSLNSDPMVSLSGNVPPSKTGSDNYMLSEFRELGQRRAETGGQIVNQYRMGAIVTPLSSGDMNLGFEQTVLAYIPPQMRGGNARRAANDPFAQLFGRDSLFDRMTSREELRLKTQSQALKVDPLPAEGRPQHFSGAIGEFRVSAPELSASRTRVGEPVTLSFSVEGIGNFDRIQPPALQDSAQWRSYSPQSQFQPQDAVGYSGKKTFEYTLIARSDSVTETPQIDFSYFDPQSGTYVALPVPPLPISVAPGADTVGAAASERAPATQAARSEELLPFMTEYRSGQGSLSLLIDSPAFYSVQMLPAAALAAFILYRRRRLRLENDPKFARRHFARKRIRLALSSARAEAASGNASGFYHSAATALQEFLSIEEPDIVASSLASGELESRLSRIGTTAEDIALARTFLHEADALQYSASAAATPLPQRLQELELLLQKLEKLSAQSATR